MHGQADFPQNPPTFAYREYTVKDKLLTDVVSVLLDQYKEILGAWMQAAGNIISAIASTPTDRLSNSTQQNLNTFGLALQAAGNGLETEGQGTPFSLEYIGNALGTIGVLEAFTAVIIEFPEETDTTLNIQGNLLQAVGSTIAAFDETQDTTTAGSLEGFIGNIIQTIGSVIQIMGIQVQAEGSQQNDNEQNQTQNHNGHKGQDNQTGSYMKWNQQNGSKNEHQNNQSQQEGANLIAVGSWIQAIGAVIAAIGQQKEEMQELQLGIDE